MKRNKKILLTVISVILLVALVASFVACKEEVDPDDNKEVASELFTNGSFSGADGTSYPLTPSNWTGAPGSTSSSDSYKTPSGSDNLIAGVISTEDKTYRSNSKTYGGAANPGKIGEDNNILMIYNKVSTVYKYTSASVSLNKSSYYKLSVWVKTIGIDKNASDYNEGKSGAYIYVNGAAYAAFEAIDTEGEWKEYTTYIETSDISSQSITVVLSLGNGSKMENSMTKGWAFFDSVTLTNLTDVEEGETAWTQEDFNKVETGETVSKYTMKLADADFDYTTSTSSPYTPSKYTAVKGTGNGDDAPSASDYITKGILKTAETLNVINSADNSEITVTTHDGAAGRIYYQQNKKATAYGIRSSVATRFLGGEQYYKLSIWVRTVIADADKGMTVKLTNGSSDATVYFEAENINTAGEWKQIDLYVEANQFRYQDVYLEFWLGEGGADDTSTHAQGIFFVDDMSLTNITAEEYAAATESETVYKHSFASELTEDSLVNLANFGEDNGDNAITGRSSFGVADTANWESGSYAGIENPGSPTSLATSVLTINNYLPSVYNLSNIYEKEDGTISDGSYTVNPNSYYVFAMWIKTKDIDSSTGVNVSLVSYDSEKDYEDSKTTLATFSTLNTENLADYKSANNSDYTEIRFFVQTGSESAKIGFNVSLGSGSANDSSSHAMGYAFISTVTVEKVTAADYSSASTSTVLKTYSFVSSGSSAEVSSNGYFKQTDNKATQELYGDEVYNENGILTGALGVPSNWTATNSDALKNKEVTAGVLDINNAEQKAAAGISIDPETFYSSMNIAGINATDYPNVLAIKGNAAYFGYKSNTISLSSDSYYIVSVWAKMEAGSVITVTLDTTTKSANYTVTPIRAADMGTDWQQYTFLVKTSATSVSATLGLYIGSEEGSAGEVKTAYFTMATYTSVSEKAFNSLVASATEAGDMDKTVFERSFNTDSFDSYTASDDAAFTPSNWTGAKIGDDASTDSDDLTAGVFNRKEGDWSLLDIDPDNDADDAIVNAIYNNTDDNYVGDNVLVIYNKNANAYKYTSSSSITLKGEKYYKISVWVLTYGLEKDDTATISLKLNNLSYTFGKQNRTEDTDVKRVVNTSTYAEDGTETVGSWTQYNFYVKTEKDVTPTATLTLSLGFEDEENFVKGYAFFDNFTVDEITEEEFIKRKEVAGETEETIDESLIADELVPNNYRIVFTQEDADAEEEPEEKETPETNPATDYLWLWISSGVLGALLIVAVIVVLYRKFSKKSKKLVKSGNKKQVSAPTKTNKKDKYSK